jgi:hypothetical protein
MRLHISGMRVSHFDTVQSPLPAFFTSLTLVKVMPGERSRV